MGVDGEGSKGWGEWRKDGKDGDKVWKKRKGYEALKD